MRKSGQFLLLMLLVLGLYSLSSCGGGASSTLGSSIDLPGASTNGVTSGDFKAIRYNDRGYEDSSLNPTLDLQVSQDGTMTTVTVAIADMDPMLGAAVELFYNPASYSPVSTEFSGLVDTPVELASSLRSGVVSLGQVDTNGSSLRSGEFATVTFANSPLRLASAAGDAHQFPVNRGYTPAQAGAPNIPSGFVITKATVDATDAAYKIYPFFAVGDGNSDGASTLGDLTAMVFNGYFGSVNAITAADWGTMTSDYDGNGETNPADLSALGPRLGEATTSIDVLIKDNDGADFAGTETVVANHTWASGTAPARPPADDTVDVDALVRTWTGTVDAAAVAAADTNADGVVLLSAIAKGAGASSPPFTDPALTITGTPPGPAGVVVTGFTGNIDAGTDQPFDGATGMVTLTAGETINLDITGINGTFDPGGGAPSENFVGGPSASMDQADYDDALVLVQNAATWAVGTAGDSTANEFRTSVPVLNLAATTGSGISGTVTPDADNPDSTDLTTPEGTLSLNIPASGTFIPLAITADIDVDVLDDANAPVLQGVFTDQPNQGSYLGLNSAGATGLTAEFVPGGAALPADLADISVSLVPTYGAGEAVTGGGAISLTYVAVGPPGVGEFTATPVIGPPAGVRINASIPSSALPGTIYALQVSYDNAGSTVTSSVNYPADSFATTGPPPTPVDFESIPSGTLIGKHDALLILYPEPIIRRDPRVAVGGGDVTPADAAGYADIVKATGSSFALTSESRTGGGFNNFPQVVLIAGNDPTGITSTTVGEAASVSFRGPGGIVLDISNQTFAGAADVEYAYKVFGAAADQANWPTLGTGTFTYSPTGIAPGGPAGIDYGMNVFDGATRGDLDLASRDFTSKVLDASSINTAQSDVLFIEVSNFGFFDFDVVDPFDYAAPLSINNTCLRLTDAADNSQTMTVGLVPVAAELTVTGNVLVMLEFTADHFSNIGVPAWPGILMPGASYELTLVDPQAPASDFTFPDDMLVTGVNPN